MRPDESMTQHHSAYLTRRSGAAGRTANMVWL